MRVKILNSIEFPEYLRQIYEDDNVVGPAPGLWLPFLVLFLTDPGILLTLF